jgi:hypothetical protein
MKYITRAVHTLGGKIDRTIGCDGVSFSSNSGNRVGDGDLLAWLCLSGDGNFGGCLFVGDADLDRLLRRGGWTISCSKDPKAPANRTLVEQCVKRGAN